MTQTYNPAKQIDHAELLYKILPAIYRDKDSSRDLQKYLNASGLLLNQLHQTLLQRYADIFPDSDSAFGLDSQTWLLPYIADLFDVRLVSPHVEGQREEIANAISWRKAKGTIDVVEQIAEAIGNLEVVVHEGWKRVATTARPGMPVLALEAYGYSDQSNYSDGFKQHQKSATPDLAPLWARHPALPAGTVDLRCPGGAVKATADNPAALISRLNQKQYRWRQSSLHGAPACNKGHSILPMQNRTPDWIPGYFDDASVRTVDFRNPGWRQGHYHPRRVLLYSAAHPGFFQPVPPNRRFSWPENLTDLLTNPQFIKRVKVEMNGAELTLRNKSLDEKIFRPILIRKPVRLGQVASGIGPADPARWRFEGFIFSRTIELDSGRLELDRCAVFAAEVHSVDLNNPVLSADNCLLKKLQAASGLVRLQYCTILNRSIVEKLFASDCIFNGLIRKDHNPASKPGKGCVRYSSLLPTQDSGELYLFHTQAVKAVFKTEIFPRAGCGVLHCANPTQISTGAEDGAEMGAYHHLYLSARTQAVLKKLEDFLPAGMQAVVIPDDSLADLPGEFSNPPDPA
ncbi:MAG: hypothetical protein H8E21_11845 [Gammaproteobacteria bacterium]|nr:hypothetical protein [Gammaproteobacteria bacterium]